MLSPFDDYPIHQTAEPLAHVATGDRNAYDRYFFHGYDRAGETFFGAALGVYPNRQVIDASFSVVRDGRQRSVHASGRLPTFDRPTEVGPIRIEVVRPLHTLRVIVDDRDDALGVAADLMFTARTVAVEEPRHTARSGATVLLDATRLTQWGDWSGSIRVDDTTVAIDPATHIGIRDRSWGIRPVGEAVGGAPSHDLPQIFWCWSPIRFDDGCLHAGVMEHADGRRWFQFAASVPLLAPGADDTLDRLDTVEPLRDLTFDLDWAAGTRLAAQARLGFVPWNADPVEVVLDPIARFPLRWLGYTNPDWTHGSWKGESVVGSESWAITDLDPLDVHNLHVQQLCRATCGDEVGIGVLEQLVLGPHDPSGVTGFLDAAG